nr:hypothetical protein [Tanacetum cinerariifolium]
MAIGGPWWRSAVNGGDRRSMVAVNGDRRWRTIIDHRRTTVDHHRSTVVDRPGQVGSHLHSTSYIIISRQAAATWQPPIGQPPLTWHPGQRRSTPSDHRSMAAVYDGDRRSMVAISGQWWRSAVNGGGQRRSPVANHR